MIGYCTECHRVRHVTQVNWSRTAQMRGVPHGVCTECARKEKER